MHVLDRQQACPGNSGHNLRAVFIIMKAFMMKKGLAGLMNRLVFIRMNRLVFIRMNRRVSLPVRAGSSLSARMSPGEPGGGSAGFLSNVPICIRMETIGLEPITSYLQNMRSTD